MAQKLWYHTFSSPLGWILLAAQDEGIGLLDFLGSVPPSDEAVHALLRKHYPQASMESGEENPLIQEVKAAVLRYLEDGTPFPAFPLAPAGGTPFQQKVWQALRDIPFGQTRSYLQVAQILDHPRSARAIGQACSRNPIPILIPCHRVVAVGGKMGGYTGGIDIKKALLKVEQHR